MRWLTLAIACLAGFALSGCESPPPAVPPEFAEQAPAPPEPAAPAEPAPVVTPEQQAAQAAAAAPGAEGAAAIAKAREQLMKQQGNADGAVPPAEAPAAEPAAAEPAPGEAAPAEGVPPAAAPEAAPDGAAAEPPAEGEQLEKAEAGAGAKGRDYGGPGFVTTPIETMFRVEDRLAFDVKVPEAMKLYKAEHNNKGPKSHAEFMKVIIEANRIQLPELPAGNSYWYDAKTETLMVRSPKPAAS
jgi:hypothetical protein